LAPVFVVDCRTIFYSNCAHKNFSLNSSKPGMFCDSDLFSSCEQRSAFVLHEEHDEFRRFGFACVPPNDVNIIRAFIEGLTSGQSHFFSASHLHHDRAFEHIDKPICIVPMDWVYVAWRIFHGDHQTFFARKVWQVFRQKVGYLSLLCQQRAGHETCEYQNCFCERHKINLSLSRRHFNASVCIGRYIAATRSADEFLSTRSQSSRSRNFSCGLGEPGFETRFTEPCVIAREQCSLAEFRPGIKRFWVSDDFARIFERRQAPPYQFIQAKLFRACNFDDAVYRRAYCNSSHATRDIVGSHGLEKHRWQMHLAVDYGNVGNALEELEKLRGMHDGVGD